MADLIDADKVLPGPPMEQGGRTHDSSYSGMEIVRKFHVPKWSDFLSVQRALHGRVEGSTGNWKRTPPLRDTYVKNCYCNETQVDFAHPNAPKTIPSLAGGGASIKAQLENQAETLQKGTAGAIVTAHYRPLITAWQPKPTGNAEQDAAVPTDVWDWIDPIFTPGIMQLPWPGGLHVAVEADLFKTRDVPDEAAQPIAVPVSDFSVKRILVGEPPWIEEKALANAINADEWPAEGSPAALGLQMTFPKGTLKFIDMDLRNMIDAEGKRWYEVTLNFKWVHFVSARIHDDDGKLIEAGHVTWNHMLMRPTGFPVGWYTVFLSGTREELGMNLDFLRPGMAIKEGKLHHTGNFDTIFKLNP